MPALSPISPNGWNPAGNIGADMSPGAILVIVLMVLLLGGFSGRFGGYGYGYGHRGIGLLSVALILIGILLLTGRI